MSILKRIAKTITIFSLCLASMGIMALFLLNFPVWFFVAVVIAGLIFWIYLSEKY